MNKSLILKGIQEPIIGWQIVINKGFEKLIHLQMLVKELYEVIVFPKIFNARNFYSKGLYRLEISLTAQQQATDKVVRGFPFFIEGPDATKNQDKKAKTIISRDKLAYCSQNFYVTFSSESLYFHTLPYFKIQIEKQKQYKICLEFRLILTQYKISKNNGFNKKDNLKNNESSISLSQIQQKIVEVDNKKIFLNNMKDLNTYQRINFCEPDYFSFTDAYIFSMRTSSSIMLHNFTFQEFYNFSIQNRMKLHQNKPEEFNLLTDELKQGSVAQLKKYLKDDVTIFYRFLVQQIAEYKRLAKVYLHYRSVIMTMNSSTINESVAIPFLDDIGKSIVQGPNNISHSQAEIRLKLQEYYQSDCQAEIYCQIIHEAELITKNKKWLLSQLQHVLINISYNIFDILAAPVIKNKTQKKMQHFIFHGDIQKQKTCKHSEFMKFRNNYTKTEEIVEDVDFKHPFIMLQGHQCQVLQNNFKEALPHYVVQSLVVFVHGYQGTDFDLEIAKYNLEMYNSHCYCLMSNSIQDDMDKPIQYLGFQLATQVKQHIKHSYSSYKRINFIGYSLGGIVVREAIKYLEQYKDKMNIFLSLASPHAGTIDGTNILIKTGIWYLINFQNAKNIKQLHCQFEGTEDENFILKKLSEYNSLQWFKRFIVASSQQDSFVPYKSSRIDEVDSSSIVKLMCQNIKKRIKRLERIEVWFDGSDDFGALDRILGRKAHIQFLENKVFLQCLFQLYANQF